MGACVDDLVKMVDPDKSMMGPNGDPGTVILLSPLGCQSLLGVLKDPLGYPLLGKDQLESTGE